MTELEWEDDRLAQAIYAYHESREDPPRPYLGASEIGEECERRLWYRFRWAALEKFPGRILRLFRTGHLQELRVYDELEGAGLEVKPADEDGRQFRFVDLGGHFSGGCDGFVRGVPGAEKTWHLLEIKTHNAKSFADLKKHGAQKSKPKHFDQMQIYMRKFGLDRALYFAVNKDTDEIYTERVALDKEHAERIEGKALRIISNALPGPKISERPDWYQCKFCPAHGVCHGQQVAEVSCRTCVHATPIASGEGGEWRCERYDCELPEENQRRGCLSHLMIPELVPFAKAVEAGDDWIKFERRDNGKPFYVVGDTGFPGDDSPHYSSRDLSAADPASVCDEKVEIVRVVMGGGDEGSEQ